jgi:phenylacetate-CoA oxygenase PaaI subunit
VSSVVTPLATDAIAAMVVSFADNKAALGYRYGEWAVSAPTIEAAVAAAAMAQDELGHARATYSILDKLGHARGDDGAGTGSPLPVIACELPDWPAMIAANLVLDAILTTWVAAARDSAIEPLAARARKILQEEGAHRIHAEAWAARLYRAGGADRERLLRHVGEMWDQAARWPGPDDDPGYLAALRDGLLSRRPSEIRQQVRGWLSALLGGVGATLELPEPDDFRSWNESRRY